MAEIATKIELTSSEPVARRRGRLHGGPSLRTYVVLIAAVFFSVFPLYWMFVVASQSTAAINSVPPAMIPGPNFIEHVQEVFKNAPMGRALINSAIVSGAVAISQTLLCSLAGFAFAKLTFPGRKILFVIVVGTMMVPTQLGVIPQFMLVKILGWNNSLLALIVPGLVTAFGVFWMRQHIGSAIPDEVIQAAKVDGASVFRIFRSIVFPMIQTAAAVLGLFAFLGAWNDFFWPLIVLQKPDSWTAQVALRQVQQQAYITDYGTQMAGTVVVTLPLLIFALIMGRQLISGIMEGAVKG